VVSKQHANVRFGRSNLSKLHGKTTTLRSLGEIKVSRCQERGRGASPVYGLAEVADVEHDDGERFYGKHGLRLGGRVGGEGRPAGRSTRTT